MTSPLHCRDCQPNSHLIGKERTRNASRIYLLEDKLLFELIRGNNGSLTQFFASFSPFQCRPALPSSILCLAAYSANSWYCSNCANLCWCQDAEPPSLQFQNTCCHSDAAVVTYMQCCVWYLVRIWLAGQDQQAKCDILTRVWHTQLKFVHLTRSYSSFTHMSWTCN